MGYSSHMYLGELEIRKGITPELVLTKYQKLKDEARKKDGQLFSDLDKKEVYPNFNHWFNQVSNEFIVTNVTEHNFSEVPLGHPFIDDGDGKWYEEWTEPLMKWLSQYFHGEVTFEGEDGEFWRYYFPIDEPGRIIYQERKKYYGSIVDHLIELHGDDMSDKLKKELSKFKLALKI